MHHGRVYAASGGEGLGCTFTVDIPATIHKDALPNDSREELLGLNDQSNIRMSVSGTPMKRANRGISQSTSIRCPDVDTTPSSIKSNIRILVVDDAAISRRMLCRYLKESYSRVDEAIDGVDALLKVKAAMEEQDDADCYRAILMDYEMPRMNGPDAVKELRVRGFTGVIIGITGNALQEHIQIFMSHGANLVLPKPVNGEELENVLAGKWKIKKLRSHFYLF